MNWYVCYPSVSQPSPTHHLIPWISFCLSLHLTKNLSANCLWSPHKWLDMTHHLYQIHDLANKLIIIRYSRSLSPLWPFQGHISICGSCNILVSNNRLTLINHWFINDWINKSLSRTLTLGMKHLPFLIGALLDLCFHQIQNHFQNKHLYFT